MWKGTFCIHSRVRSRCSPPFLGSMLRCKILFRPSPLKQLLNISVGVNSKERLESAPNQCPTGASHVRLFSFFTPSIISSEEKTKHVWLTIREWSVSTARKPQKPWTCFRGWGSTSRKSWFYRCHGEEGRITSIAPVWLCISLFL